MKLLLLFLLLTTTVFSQEKIIKKLEKELHTELTQIHSIDLNSIDSSELIDETSPNSKELVIGQSYRGEYVRNGLVNSARKVFLTSDYVSKSQYSQFQKWVQDSIARDRIYFGLEEDQDAIELINYENYFFWENGREYMEFEPSDRELNRELFPLDWSYKFKYDDSEIMPLIANTYILRPEYFRKNRIIDQRKMIHYSKLFSGDSNYRKFPISPDNYDFALKALHPFDRWSVYAFLNNEIDLNKPVTNIQPFMAELYCEWMTEQVKKELNTGKSGYTIQFRLPSASEALMVKAVSNSIVEFKEINVSDQWRITNNEFREFSNHALDSIYRDAIYFGIESNEEADKFILTDWPSRNLNILYYSERIGYEPDNRDLNREFANLNYKTKFKKTEEYQSIKKDVNEKCAESVPYRYTWMDAPSRSIKGKVTNRVDAINPNYSVTTYILDSIDASGEDVGEDLDLTRNLDGRTARDHKNIGRFIRHEQLMIPNASELPENDNLVEITYEQALAYYNWKFRIDKFQKGDDWQQFVFPTEEEFNQIKNGESIVYPVQEIEYDAPVFRMVVELIPKK